MAEILIDVLTCDGYFDFKNGGATTNDSGLTVNT